MDSTDVDTAINRYGQNLHTAHELRTAGTVTTPWQFLGDKYQEEYLQVAKDIHAALYLGDGDVKAAAAHLVSHYHNPYRVGAQPYWERRVREAQGKR